MARDRLYLDHAATTPVLPEAQAAIAEALSGWANPSSPHADGRAARAALEKARADIAQALDWRHDVILTSGASEAIAIVAARAAAARRLIGATEHDAVVAAMGGEAQVIPVDERGRIDLAALEAALTGEPALVAVQQVNNETGVIQPIDEIAAMVRAAGSLLLADCAQGAGKIPLPNADFIAVSAHKLGGPPGMGALLVRDIATLAPSGGQEKGYRRGTENLPAAAGFAAALQSRAFVEAMPKLAELRGRLEEAIDVIGGRVRPEADPDHRAGDFRRNAHRFEHAARFHAPRRAGAARRNGDAGEVELDQLARARYAGHGVAADGRDALGPRPDRRTDRLLEPFP